MSITGIIKKSKINEPKNITNKRKKVCSKCKLPKHLNSFSKRTKSKDGLESACKECVKLINKKYYNNNQDYFIKYRKQYFEENKEYFTVNNRNRSKEENFLNNKKQIQKGNRAKWSAKQLKNNIQFKIKQILGSRLFIALKGKSKSSKTQQLLCCSIDEFKKYIESQFKPEMNWENWGKIWELDHIKPCDSFDLSKEKEQKKCFNYQNFQPLFKTSDIAKKFGYIHEIGNRNKSNK